MKQIDYVKYVIDRDNCVSFAKLHEEMCKVYQSPETSKHVVELLSLGELACIHVTNSINGTISYLFPINSSFNIEHGANNEANYSNKEILN